MNNNFSKQVKVILSLSHEEAVRLGSDRIKTGHLLLAAIKEDHNIVIAMLKRFQVELTELKKGIEDNLETVSDNSTQKAKRFKFFFFNRSAALPLNKEAEMAIRESVLQANSAKSQAVEVEHLLLSILKNTEDTSTKILDRFGVDYDKVNLQLQQV